MDISGQSSAYRIILPMEALVRERSCASIDQKSSSDVHSAPYRAIEVALGLFSCIKPGVSSHSAQFWGTLSHCPTAGRIYEMMLIIIDLESLKMSQKKPIANVKRLILSLLAGLVGVQSNRNREEDFTRGNIWVFIIGGIVLTTLFIVSLILLVRFLAP